MNGKRCLPKWFKSCDKVGGIDNNNYSITSTYSIGYRFVIVSEKPEHVLYFLFPFDHCRGIPANKNKNNDTIELALTITSLFPPLAEPVADQAAEEVIEIEDSINISDVRKYRFWQNYFNIVF